MKTYPCGCTASPDGVPNYCPEHGFPPSNLVVELRAVNMPGLAPLTRYAADEIERLQRERDEYRECAKSQADRAWQRLSDEPSGRCTCEHGIPNDRDCAVHGAQLRKEDGASEPPSDRYGRREPPHGYAYRYHDYRGDVLRFNNGEEVNGGMPFEVVPYWIGAPVTKSVQCSGYVAPRLSLQDLPCIHCGKLQAEHTAHETDGGRS